MPDLPRRCIFGRDTCFCYTNGALEMKVVAAVGIAPTSPRLQRGANLSQLHSRERDGPSAWYRATVFRLSGGCSTIELRRDESMKWSPDEVTLPGPPDVSRPLSF